MGCRASTSQETGARVTIHERPDSEGGCLAQKLDPSQWCEALMALAPVAHSQALLCHLGITTGGAAG